VKAIRQKLITALPVLMKNASLPEGSLKKNFNDAVILQYNMKGSTFADFIRQRTMFGDKYDRKTVYLNRLIDSGKIKFKQAIEGYNAAIMQNQGASLFGDKPSNEDIFNHWIVAGVSETDKKLIESSDMVSKGEIFGTFAGQVPVESMEKAWKENTPIKEVFEAAGKEYPKPEPKFKVGDYVRYKQGDVDIEHWYGIIKEVRDLGNEYAYRIDGYGLNEDNSVMFDSEKTNEKYEPQLTLLGTVSLFENLKQEYDKIKSKDSLSHLGTGAKVHFSTTHYRVNDNSLEGGFILVARSKEDNQFSTSHDFNNLDEAMFVVKKLSHIYPDGVPQALLIDKYIENLKQEYEQSKNKVMPAKEYFTKSNAPDNIKDRFGISKTQDRTIIENVPKSFDSKLPGIGEEVYIVDGKYVRDNIYSDFSQGGNDMAYPEFVPIGELWVEKDMLAEKDHILRHEKRERDLMINAGYIHKVNETKALTYEEAHKIVKDLEDKERGIEANKEVKSDEQILSTGDAYADYVINEVGHKFAQSCPKHIFER